MKLLKLRNNLTFNIISAIMVLLVVFSVLVSVIGYYNFTNSLTREYTDMGYRTASTAVALLDGDKIEQYLANGEDDPDYAVVQQRLDLLCVRMDVSLIYVIRVDTTDYNSFLSVFNSVNARSTRYTRWEAGHYRETTNETYRRYYIDLYENGASYRTIFRTTKLNGAEPHLTVMVPVKSDRGETTAIMCVQRPMMELVNGRKPYLRSIILATLLLCVLSAVTSFFYIRRQFVSPLRTVEHEANRFAEQTSAPEKPLDPQISRINEISVLAESVNTMEQDMLRYMENLTAVTAEKERIGTELNIARQIQAGSVPSLFPAYPDRTEFDIYASMTPAKEVGGDFYDFFFIDSDHLALVMADVSGKGVPAALFMMVTKILLSDRALMGGTPGEILSFINDRICENNRADMFVTVWLGILEVSTGKLLYANAGHDDPAVYRNGGAFELIKSRHGLVIGGMGGVRYRDNEMQLNPGDKLFLYTDGVPEATDKEEKMFTLEGMMNTLNTQKDGTPKEVLQSVWDGVQAFIGDAPQFDDLTMLCLQMKEEADCSQTLIIDAKTEKLPEVNDFIDAFLEKADCPMKAQMQIDLCVEEVFVNIASYAYGSGEGKAEIRISEQQGEVTLTFLDSGTPYDPLQKEDPDTKLDAESRKIGGLGIFLVKKNMDDVQYRFVQGKNMLTMKKRIHS